LYTEQVESDWTQVAIRDDEELKNTAFDCRQCHARARAHNGLLMRELEKPWTHFFLPNVKVDPAGLPGVSGLDLTRDFVRAHGDETYANVPAPVMQQCSPPFLQGIAGEQQPLFFDAETIGRERWTLGAKADPQPSPAWEKAYAAFKRGEQLALPYLDARATDSLKQAQLTEAYTRYRNGELSAALLPDLADIFPDDPELRARIGLEVSPEASAPEALIQACGSCHNDVLDQSLSRARFNIDLSRLDREELDRAIERVQLPPTASAAMPPAEFRQLTAEQRERVIAYLKRDPSDADESLKQAAALGMAGGARQP
jgi:mono/diheme cytochrome c family protein